MTTETEKSTREIAEEIVKKISDAAIELAFVRHELTTSDYENEDHGDIEEGVEAFKALVEEVKTDVLAVLTGDDTGCLDPEDVDYDNETEWTARLIDKALRDRDERAAGIAESIFEPAHTYTSENASEYRAYDRGQQYAMKRIASAIRGTK